MSSRFRPLIVALAALAGALVSPSGPAAAQDTARVFTHADTLRGSNTPQRAWWDAAFYDLHVRFDPAERSIRGYDGITYRVLAAAPAAPHAAGAAAGDDGAGAAAREMQLDLQQPLGVDSVVQEGRRLTYRRDGNAYFVALTAPQPVGGTKTVTVYYHGSFAAGDGTGGRRWAPVHWEADSLGTPWIETSVEGPGPSAWWPVKDYPGDEPDSQRIAITVPNPMVDVSNGRLRSTTHNPDGTTTFEWFVENPINGYDVEANANAHYVHFGDTYYGEGGTLSLDFWPLSYHLDAAKARFPSGAKAMLACFEHWFGPYPWYRDGYKLIETSYLGMEHQSGIAYGNRYLDGYLGRDLSGTGLGMSWDYIIVHESAHEWWGNSVSAADHADMWIHESFGMYAEGLYLECEQGKAAGEKYLEGVRARIQNDVPIQGRYGVSDVPRSQDRYFKGSNMLMTIRHVVDDDAKWREVLRGIQSTFRHQTVSGAQIEQYMSRASGVDLSRIFQQYLSTTMVPVLEYRLSGSTLSYRWSHVVPGFDMPVDVTVADGEYGRIRPTEQWQTTTVRLTSPAAFHVADAFYVEARDVGTAGGPAGGSR